MTGSLVLTTFVWLFLWLGPLLGSCASFIGAQADVARLERGDCVRAERVASDGSPEHPASAVRQEAATWLAGSSVVVITLSAAWSRRDRRFVRRRPEGR